MAYDYCKNKSKLLAWYLRPYSTYTYLLYVSNLISSFFFTSHLRCCLLQEDLDSPVTLGEVSYSVSS